MDRDEMHHVRRFTFRSELDKALHSLQGILKGIGLDGEITQTEVAELRRWAMNHYDFIDRQPFKELIPVIMKSVDDGRMNPDEMQDLLWVSNNVKPESLYYDIITNDMQTLHGIIHGILADGEISDAEIHGLSKWLFNNETLKGCYPYDELCSLITAISADGVIDDSERNALKLFLSEFVDTPQIKAVDQQELARLKKEITISGICALDPDIILNDRLYCVTGVLRQGDRAEFVSAVQAHGGIYKDTLSNETDYLIVGSKGNPCWAFACYGRKVQKAIQMRKDGLPIIIASELDFWDALQ